MYGRIHNFSAGPSALPEPVLEKARDQLLNLEGAGMSVMEMSHRSKEFEKVINDAEAGLRRIMQISPKQQVLFLQGGATMQFAMVPLNLYQKDKPIDLIHTGVWTKKAKAEAEKLAQVKVAGSSEDKKFSYLPTAEQLNLNPDASYVYICSNNTVVGTQWKAYPVTGSVPLVADMSSDILSKRIATERFGLIFAGAQKNVGPSGVAVVIMDEELAKNCPDTVPTMLQYKEHIKAKSLYNTPPTFGIYMIKLVTEWIEEEGGMDVMEERNKKKAKRLYDAIDSTDFYYSPVQKDCRSTMNVVYRIHGDNEELEAKFVTEAKANGLSGLKGHRLVGGLRASIYNAQPVEAIEALISFMKEFEKKNG